MYLNKFSVPDISLDHIAVEQAALTNAIIITPTYHNSGIVEALRNYIKETGLTYSDGTEIEVCSWNNMLDEKNLATKKNIVIYQPTDMLLEMLGEHKFENVILVENNDSI